MKRFQHVLDASGVNTALSREGVREGDAVVIGQVPRRRLKLGGWVFGRFLVFSVFWGVVLGFRKGEVDTRTMLLRKFVDSEYESV